MDAPIAAEDRTNLRDVAVPIAMTIIAVTLYGAAAPAVTRIAPDLAGIVLAMDPGSASLPALVVGFTTLLLAVWASQAIREHRPWPFARRRGGPRSRDWRETLATLAALIASFAVQMATNDWWEASAIRELGDGRFLWVGVPAGYAARWVVWAAVFGFAYVLAHLVIGRWTRWHSSPVARVDHGTAAQG